MSNLTHFRASDGSVISEKYYYSPFGHDIADSHSKYEEANNLPSRNKIITRGLYMTNNPRAQEWLKDKTDFERMMREVLDSNQDKERADLERMSEYHPSNRVCHRLYSLSLLLIISEFFESSVTS